MEVHFWTVAPGDAVGVAFAVAFGVNAFVAFIVAAVAAFGVNASGAPLADVPSAAALERKSYC